MISIRSTLTSILFRFFKFLNAFQTNKSNAVRRSSLSIPKSMGDDSVVKSDLIFQHQSEIAKHPAAAWDVLDAYLRPRDENSAFWWRATGYVLAEMLAQADYSPHGQYGCLLFHLHFVVSHLGPCPNHKMKPSSWKSFMTDDHSPIELSWCWDTPRTPPKVRYAIEAIGNRAGTTDDPYNAQETLVSVQQLRNSLPGTDWQLFDHFIDELALKSIAKEQQSRKKDRSDAASTMLAYELRDSAPPAAKAYFIPVIADQLHQSRLSAVTEAIDLLHARFPTVRISAYNSLVHFLTHHQLGLDMSIVGVAVDCTEPSASRLKIYVRSPSTAFKSVCTIMSLGGTAPYPNSPTDFEPLRKLWYRLFSVDDDAHRFSDDDELSPTTHETAGTLYHFDVATGKEDVAEAKLYIPVKHYGRNDGAIGESLIGYLQEEGRGAYTENFRRVLEALSPHRTLESRCGIQTYVACSMKKSGMALTSYFSPEIYAPERDV
ncbi:MAG: hypothetical protein L6R37_007866 [Teloschistes peruensis]|nr:MAG: hypothetical protein L6R37_007866 [Teloschistes peruensis]